MKNLIIRLARGAGSPRRGQRVKARLSIFCSFFLIPILFGIASSIYISSTLHELAYTRRQAIALPIARTLEEKLNKFVALGQIISAHPKVREAVLAGDWDKAAEVLQVFHTFVDEPNLDRMTIEDALGILKVDTPHREEVVGKDFSYRDWYKGVQETGKPYVSEVYRRAAQPVYNIVAVAMPILDENGLLKAILLLQLKSDMFLEVIESIKLGNDGFVYILDQHGHIVAHPHFDPQGEIIDFTSAPITKLLKDKKAGVEITYNPIEKQERLTAYETVGRYGWGVVVQEPTKQAFASRNFIVLIFATLYGIALLFFAALVGPIVRAINEHDCSKK